MTGYLKLILFYFFDSPEKNFTRAENVNIFTILQNKLYKIAFFSKTTKNRASGLSQSKYFNLTNKLNYLFIKFDNV